MLNLKFTPPQTTYCLAFSFFLTSIICRFIIFFIFTISIATTKKRGDGNAVLFKKKRLLKKVNTKRIVWISVFVVIVGGGLTYLMFAKNPIGFNNPEIFPAFRKIENYALLYVEQETVDREEYERCKAVVSRMEEDAKMLNENPDYFPLAEEYYNFLISLGFKLPPFKLDKPSAKEEREQSMREQEQLLEQQNNIYEQTMNKYLREIDE